MKVCAFNEVSDTERRVALTPDVVPILKKAGYEVMIEEGAGAAAGFPDNLYVEKGATVASREELIKECDVFFVLHRPDPEPFRKGQAIIGLVNPFTDLEGLRKFMDKGVEVFSLELLPRIAKAQSMDILTSMASISGYRAVILAAYYSPKALQRIVSAAAVFPPIKVLVIGAGVAGLMAIALAKKFGTDVYGYDIRPEALNDVVSVGGKPFHLKIEIEGKEVSDKFGYAKYLGEEFYRKQREAMAKALKDFDIVITTASVVGKRAPLLITEDGVKNMKPGSVIVDLAAERGGNCELTEPGKVVTKYGVTIVGLVNVPSTVPYHSSMLAARNLTNFLLYISKNGKFRIDLEDEIIKNTLLFHGGQLISQRFKEIVGGGK